MNTWQVRSDFMTAFDNVQANVYDNTPPVVTTPALFVFPANPYIEYPRVGAAHINLRLTAAVTYLDNASALDNLEVLIDEVLRALPDGTSITAWSAPAIQQVGPSNLLVSDMTITLATTL